MKKTLTVTLSIDNEWVDEDTGEKHIDSEQDLLAYAMDLIRPLIELESDEFVKTELDGNLLFAKNGDAPDAVKKLPQYDCLLKSLQSAGIIS